MCNRRLAFVDFQVEIRHWHWPICSSSFVQLVAERDFARASSTNARVLRVFARELRERESLATRDASTFISCIMIARFVVGVFVAGKSREVETFVTKPLRIFGAGQAYSKRG